jgi:hypothetical protein
VTRAQILSVGGTDTWIKWAIQDSRLKGVSAGVYAVVGPDHERQPLMAACLAAGPSSAVSHLAAAALWGAEQVMVNYPEITTFGNRRHLIEGAITHRSRLDAAEATTHHGNLPVVVAALTVVQVAWTCTPYLAGSVANDLVRRHRTSFPAILRWVDITSGGRRSQLRELCLRAIEVGGHDDSPAARILGERLIGAGATGFQTDYRVETPGGPLFIDYAWPPEMVGLEYNGVRDHHTSPLDLGADARRRARLSALGWQMIDVNKSMKYDDVVGWILDALSVARSRNRAR